MLLHAVIVPPPDVLVAVSQVLLSIDSVAAAAPPPQPASRFLRRRVVTPPEPESNTPDDELDLIPPTAMNLPITGFGNVTAGDAARLADTLNDAAAEWACPTVWLAGGGALEFPDDRCVWAKLDGDIDALLTIGRGVVDSVASRGFFVDRRRFRPWLAVATITEATTAPYLERVLAALDEFRGEPWTIESVSVTKPSFDPALGEWREAYRIPLATP